MANDSQARHDVFISYSSKDKKWADAACGVLEMHKIRCWIAPRDITPGTEWGASIISGMDSSKVMVLIFSTHANQSAQVRREVECAIGKGLIVLPFRIEDVSPEGAMEYALSNTHWLDGFTPPLEQQFALLARSVNVLLGKDVEPMAATAPAKPAVVASARPREGLRVTDDGPAKTKGSPRPEPKTEGLARFRETESSNRADPDVAAEPRRPRALWPIAIAASLCGLVALGAIMLAIQNRKGENKTGLADASSDQIGRDGKFVRHDRSENGPARDVNPPRGSSGAKPQIPGLRPKLIPPAGPARRALVVGGALWTVENDQLVKEGVGFAFVNFGDPGWTDYDCTFEVRKSAGPDGFGVEFAGSDGKGYGVEIGRPGNKHVLHSSEKMSNGAWTATPIRSRPGTIQPLEWYKLKISLRRSHAHIELDDHSLFDFTTKQGSAGAKGGVQLRTYGCAIRFRNIKVTAPDGTVLWEGPPDLPEK